MTKRWGRSASFARVLTVLAVAAFATACSDSTGPGQGQEALAGTYVMTELVFDPQGSLPATNIAARLAALGRMTPVLNLTATGELQLLFQDPASGLLRLVDGTFRTSGTGTVLEFGSATHYRALLLGDQMTFQVGANGSLVFEGAAPGGVSRQALIGLVPEWSNEPIVDPTPGNARVVFARTE